MTTYLALSAAALGLSTSILILRKKRLKKTLVCPLKADCDKVLHSTYGDTLGIPNEVLGILYYLTIGTLYTATLVPQVYLSTSLAYYLIAIFSLLGGLFSLYLIFLQAFVIRAWCSWCMLSALSSLVLLVSAFLIPISNYASVLDLHRPWWLIAHGIGFILGLGAAVMTDVLFFRFLKDHQISSEEQDTFETITRVIWVGLAILVVSGTMLYLSDVARLSVSSKFLVKAAIVGVVIINGVLLNLLVSPRLRQLSFDGAAPARRYRRLAFALGGISMVSWVSAFILGSLRSIPVSFQQGMVIYGILLLVTFIGSQVTERRMTRAMRPLD